MAATRPARKAASSSDMLLTGRHEVVSEDSQLTDQARAVAIGERPLCADRSSIRRDGHDRNRAQVALACEPEMLLKHLDHRDGALIGWPARHSAQRGNGGSACAALVVHDVPHSPAALPVVNKSGVASPYPTISATLNPVVEAGGLVMWK
jgi:hypothetical protein